MEQPNPLAALSLIIWFLMFIPCFRMGSKSWVWLEDGLTTLMSRPSLLYAFRLRLQEVAERAISISTDHLSGWEKLKS